MINKKNKIKLLYITNGITGSGGLERVLAVKTSLLADKYDYDIHILVLNEVNPKPFYQFSSKIEYHTVIANGNPLKYFILYRKGIKQIINKIKPDIISVCDDGLKGLLFPVIFEKKIPVIYERHASYNITLKKDKLSLFQQLKANILKKIAKWGAKRFDKFIVLTNNNLKEWNLPNMLVIPNAVSFYPKKSSTLDNKKVLAIGSYSFNKGYDRLIFIWDKVIKKYPDWKLDIYGKNSKKIEKLIKNNNLRDTIGLHNPVNNIQEKYLESSIFVLPSRSEGFGMVLIEAMACGVPCIAFDCPSGPADIIKHKEDGYVIKNGDVKAFANTLINLIKDEEKRKQMGAVAKKMFSAICLKIL